MDGQHIVNEYQARAQEAEEYAARCADPAMKQSWLNIASSYRQMAQSWLDRMAAATTVEQSPQVSAEVDENG
jgi:hypothetical protein